MPAPILSIQSHVVYGHVGNAAAVFPLQRLGREVWPLMSVQFSSHTAYMGWRGRAFDAGMIDECIAGLGAIGVLPRCAGLLTGYLGRPEIGAAALRALDSIRAANPDAVYACDPVIGDVDRGIYVAAGVAEFFRDQAIPTATLITPNAFELEWLTGAPVTTIAETGAAMASLKRLGPRVVAATSLVLADTPPDSLDVLASDESGLWRVRTPKLPISLSGAGDLFAALFLHHWLAERSAAEGLSRAASSVFGVVAATLRSGALELDIVGAQDEFVSPSKQFRAEPVSS